MELDIQGNPGIGNRFDETHIARVDSLCPHATEVVQNYFIGDQYAVQALQEMRRKTEEDTTIHVMDMFHCSATRPKPVPNEIIRKQELELCEKRLEKDSILYLTGEEGVGLTTLVAQFARLHGTHCVSYFNNGLDRILLTPEFIERDIVSQLLWYVTSGKSFQLDDADRFNLDSIAYKVLRKMSQSESPLYFVFDGFDCISTEFVDGIRHLFEKFMWSKAKFIFTGNSKRIAKLFPAKLSMRSSENEILRFGDGDVNQYFRNVVQDITDEQLSTLRQITRCQASRMSIVLNNFIRQDRLEDLLQSDMNGLDDLYEDDYQRMFHADDTDLPYRFLSLLAYGEFCIKVPLAAEILMIDEASVEALAVRFHSCVKLDADQRLSIFTEGFHKYLRQKLSSYKQDVELSIIRVLESPVHEQEYCRFIPAMYKDLNMTERLIHYLSKENIQRILVSQCSQAALNEQCEFGYEACFTNMKRYAAGVFRFALNKSTSREVEENRLWDYEIEALLSVGRIEQAIAFAQSIYLSEERLKSLLLIARKKHLLEPADLQIIKENIDQLVASIQFEKIPGKAIELAKLLLPIDFEKAVCIVDRIASQSKDSINTDRIYTLMTLMSGSLDKEGMDNVQPDLVDTKIQDNGMRAFAHAAKNLFAEEGVDAFLSELDKLPGNTHKLHLLQMWLPEHEEMEHIGKVVLEGIKLVVAVSDTSMPRAKMLDTICRSMSRMSLEQMEQAMTHIESLSETIKYPTLDYIDAELTIIESIKDLMPERGMERLENIFFYMDELQDLSIRVSCFSKLLGRYDYLGDRKAIERNVISTVDLHKEIIDGVRRLLADTAYHVKMVEVPIMALVCEYSTFIEEFVSEVNTADRRSRIYSLAAYYYVLRSKAEKFRPELFFSFISKASAFYSDRIAPLDEFTDRLLNDEKLDPVNLLPFIKKNFFFFEEIEAVPVRCRMFMRIYRWMNRLFQDDHFVVHVKDCIIDSWHKIGYLPFQIEFGFYLAKSFARSSKETAEALLDECEQLKKETLLTSSSCLSACNQAIEIYTRSLCYLIRYGLCEEHHLEAFRQDVDRLQPVHERVVTWCTISLEYYQANNILKFKEICNRYLPNDYGSWSSYNQKYTIIHIAPALFIYGQGTFFSLLTHYDEVFRNDCIEQVTQFIIGKYAFLTDVRIESKAYNLAYDDYCNILLLMEHSTDDSHIFHTCNIIAQSLRHGRPKQILSTEQKLTIVAEAKRIVNSLLPVTTGIRHDGYKLACLGLLSYAVTDLSARELEEWDKQIDTIGNAADRSLLYFILGPCFQRRTDKEWFIRKGLVIADTIPSAYDRVNRLDLGIKECAENGLGELVKIVASKSMESLSINGNEEQHQHLIDVVYQYKPDLAERMLEQLDKDPARMRYKSSLLEHICSKKKLDQAHKEQNSVVHLNREEQFRFFQKQLDDIASDRGQVLDLQRAYNLCIEYIYSNSINLSRNAVLYLLECLYRKNKQDHQYIQLLINIHTAIRYNLKLVLSLSAGTKERLSRIERTVCLPTVSAPGYVEQGEYGKADTFLLEWYRTHPHDELIIIDPYFKPEDLYLVKELCDCNTKLNIKILCHPQQFILDDYLSEWHRVASAVTCSIQMNTVCYKHNPKDGPLHDRFWICCQYEKGLFCGLRTNSLTSFGNKESLISELQVGEILPILGSYSKYTLARPDESDGHQLAYQYQILSM